MRSVAQLQSGKNKNTFTHHRELGSELKLADIPKKNIQPKKLNPRSRLTL
jgi:hypothetical protein